MFRLTKKFEIHGSIPALLRLFPPQNFSQSAFVDFIRAALTAQPANVRARRVRCSGLHPLGKMPACSRSVSNFFDTLLELLQNELLQK